MITFAKTMLLAWKRNLTWSPKAETIPATIDDFDFDLKLELK